MALVAWGAAVWGTAAHPSVARWVAGALGVGTAVVAALVMLRRVTGRSAPPGRASRRGTARAAAPTSSRRPATPTSDHPRAAAPRSDHRRGGGVLLVVALVLGSVAVVLAVTAEHVDRRDGALRGLVDDGAVVHVTGTVAGRPTPLARPEPGMRVRLLVEEVRARGAVVPVRAPVLVLGGPGWAAHVPGTTVETTGRLVATDPGDDVLALLVVHAEPTLVDLPGPVDSAIATTRAALLTVTDDLPGDARALVPGIAVGDRSRQPVELEEAMRVAGLTHLTAVSGGHFSILGALVLSATAGLPRWLRSAVTASAMAGLVLLVGSEPSVLRAAVMGGVGLLGLLLRRPSQSAPALAVAVVVLLLMDPWLARSYGFVLSVLATGGLVLLSGPLARRFERWLPRWAARALAIPLAAQTACAPVVVLLDPRLLLLAVPGNLLAAPAMLPATVLGVGAALLAPWWPAAAAVVAHGAGAGAWWVGAVARTTASVPGAAVPWPQGWPGLVLLTVLSALAVAVLLTRSGRRRQIRRTQGAGPAGGRGPSMLAGGAAPSEPGEASAVRRWWSVVGPVLVVAAAIVLVVVVPLPGGGAVAGQWGVAACDVGQGDALVVRSGQHSAVMVDVGPPGDAAARCLADLGVSHLDLLVLTHAHQDHVGGLDAVVDAVTVGQVLVGPSAVGPASVGPTEAAAGMSGRAGEVDWEVLWPPPGGVVPGAHAGEDAVNNGSVVVLLHGPRLRVIALGDLEPRAQDALARLLRAGTGPDGLRIDVVKVAHHGSARQSRDLAEVLAAPVAVFSAGRGNSYGHPASSALELYGRYAAVTPRTDLCGTVVLVPGPGSALDVVADCPAR